MDCQELAHPACSDEKPSVFSITVRNGKVSNIREYIDTQALARASQMDASGLA
jgi:ketosteroid isomerase-like protein